MTLIQQAKEVWPGLNSQEINLVLWTCTTYPMIGNEEEVLADLKNAYERSGGDFLQALNQADEQLTNAITTKRLGS